jgi:GDP-4-dehydro-6-deoxy-D-mannose reductase
MGPEGPILVTGASGFVGRYLLDALKRDLPLHQVIAYGGPSDMGFRRLDVTNREECWAAVRDNAPSTIIHLAGQAAVAAAGADPDAAMRVNAGGTTNLAEAVLAHVPEALFLAISSGEVYGDSLAGGQPTSEFAPLKPVSAYARSKAAAEDAVRSAVGRGLHAIIARPFNHTGPGQSEAFVTPAFAACTSAH